MNFSDSQLLRKLALNDSSLSEGDIYKACVFSANSGQKNENEKNLSPAHRLLLDVRRQLYAGNIKQAQQQLNYLMHNEGNDLLLGDVYSILGNLKDAHGEKENAHDFYQKAIEKLRQANEEHRLLKISINREISLGGLHRYNSGALATLRQMTIHQGYDDLTANILKAQSEEFLTAGLTEEAQISAEQALSHFAKAGSAVDRDIARSVFAISAWLNLDIENANRAQLQIFDKNGRLASYTNILQTLFSGKTPSLELSHPLYETDWKALIRRRQGLPARLLERLKKGPAHADELIPYLWGPHSDHPSYRNRLFSTITRIREQFHIAVYFDGENYCLK